MRVLVVEDKPSAADLLRRALEHEGHCVELAYDGEQALCLGKSEDLDVIILDLMLPRVDGFTVLKKLREANRLTPTIILSARDAMEDIVRGLDSGADDYLTKPFALDVFLARVRAVARRGSVTHPVDLQFHDLTLKSTRYELQRGQRVAPLTRTEYVLLKTLLRRASRVVPKEVLIEAGWGMGVDVNESTLYVFIHSLRSKITQPGEAQLLHTLRGVGYSLRRVTA
jgi:DNA-binding response OmpR family regulator